LSVIVILTVSAVVASDPHHVMACKLACYCQYYSVSVALNTLTDQHRTSRWR